MHPLVSQAHANRLYACVRFVGHESCNGLYFSLDVLVGALRKGARFLLSLLTGRSVTGIRFRLLAWLYNLYRPIQSLIEELVPEDWHHRPISALGLARFCQLRKLK